ncbi:hypothetical protein DKT75_15250 [Leucothrix arctica]|uniref:Uncharacterized protein n=1 Tax=Leucothrix arctica TaxID=1481894 RepID=A0A317C8M4_9GAMM|nr:hypothetical protein DKT75_15250 [Leucothrix arctica]
MQYFRAILFVSVVALTNTAYGLSDGYYSQGLYMDFKIAEDDESIKQSLEGIFTKFINFVNEDETSGFSINFNYFFKSDS